MCTKPVQTKFDWHHSAIVADASNECDHQRYLEARRLNRRSGKNNRKSISNVPLKNFVEFFVALEACEEVCMEVDGINIPSARRNFDLPVFRCLTAGVTGVPAQIRRTHLSWITSFHVNAKLWGLSPRDRYGLIGNLSHTLSLYAAMEAVHLGADLHFLSELSPSQQFTELRKRQITVLYATPAQINLLQTTRRHKENVIPSLRLLLIGGSALGGKRRGALAEVFPNAEIYEFYGSSETSFVALGDQNTPSGFIGRAYPQVEISIHQESDQRNGGLITVKSPYTAIGYAFASKSSTDWQDGQVRTNDFGEMSSEGYLRLLGRSDRRVKIADKLVGPEEVESCIGELKDVNQVTVLPMADRLRNTVFAALVQVQGEALTIGAIRGHCRERLQPFKRPKTIIIVKDWPLLPSGKTDLQALQAELDQHRRQRLNALNDRITSIN